MTTQPTEKESDFEEQISELIDKIQKLSVDDKLYILDYVKKILNDVENRNIYQRRRRSILVITYQ